LLAIRIITNAMRRAAFPSSERLASILSYPCLT
jgi:hypothetical protein